MTNVYVFRWQSIALSWQLSKGLTLYIDGNFRSTTKKPNVIPVVLRKSKSAFIIGKKNGEESVGSAEFSIGSLAIYERFLRNKDMDKVFGDRSMSILAILFKICYKIYINFNGLLY